MALIRHPCLISGGRLSAREGERRERGERGREEKGGEELGSAGSSQCFGRIDTSDR